MIYSIKQTSYRVIETPPSDGDTDFLYCLNAKKVVFPGTLASLNKVFALKIHKYDIPE